MPSTPPLSHTLAGAHGCGVEAVMAAGGSEYISKFGARVNIEVGFGHE